MRIITGQVHREAFLKAIKPGMRVLEWGSGGSTLWLADRLPERATLTSIDHDTKWNTVVREKIGPRDNVRLLLVPPAGPLGANATIEEEDPTHLHDYIHAVDGEKFDLIFVDGVARGTCMDHARTLLKPGGTVYLHDAHRPWYDHAKSLFIEHGTIGSCPEYPSPTLWWGGLTPEAPKYSKGALPIVLCFYTVNTPYEEEVKRLRESCQRLGLEHEIRGIPPLSSWERTCAYKARYILNEYRRLDRPVLWCDADAVIHDLPLLVAGAEPDFAISKAAGWQFNSATIYFNRTEVAQLLLETWVKRCEEQPEIWDQIHLDSAWEEVTARRPLRTMWLPQSYAKIYDMNWEARLQSCGTTTPVIEQFQASRRFKTAVTTEAPRVMLPPGDELTAARRACRPRECWYDKRFVLLPEPPLPADWGRKLAS